MMRTMWRTTLKSIAAHKRRLLATCSAVLLGVAFLSGTLVLARTLTSGFSDILAGGANKGTDALVRSSLQVGREDVTERGLIDRSLAGTIAAVDGVAAVAPRIESDGRIVGANGDPIGGGGPPSSPTGSPTSGSTHTTWPRAARPPRRARP
jgi:putative ABC transport system permease protein